MIVQDYMENKDGQQKNGKQMIFIIYRYYGKQKNGKQTWKTNNIIYLLAK